MHRNESLPSENNPEIPFANKPSFENNMHTAFKGGTRGSRTCGSCQNCVYIYPVELRNDNLQ
jgi:hypothetical protein